MRLCAARGLPVAATLAALATLAGGAQLPDDPDVAPRAGAVVEQPRPFGYVVGDVLAQRVLLHLNGRTFTPVSLPRAERVSAWLERRAPRIESTADGRRWLTVEYQVINAPQALTLARIPAWELRGGSASDALEVAEWPISLSALTPRSAFGQGALLELRPDRPAPRIETRPIRRRIAISSGALALTLVLWVSWLLWRNRRAAASQPFAAALREIRRADERTPQAWQALHRAFDRTAGRVTQSATLPVLFERAPHLAPLRSKIELFFRQSGERFFGSGLPPDAVSVRELCADLRRIEKSHER